MKFILQATGFDDMTRSRLRPENDNPILYFFSHIPAHQHVATGGVNTSSFFWCSFFIYLVYLGCGSVTRTIVNKIGEDWVFLFMLGGIMALLSFTMDYCIAKLLEGLFV